MQQIKLGTKASKLGIQRVSCADGQKIRLALLDENPRFKYVAYDNEHKCRVEVDQDMVLRYNLKPTTIYLYLVAKLNTDMNGKIVGSEFTVEYLQLSENLNSDFSDAVQEAPEFKTIVGTKVKKSVEGKDFSYITVKPSATDIEGQLASRIQELKSNPEFIEATWALVDAATSLTKEQYEYRLQNPINVSAAQDSVNRQIAAAQAPKQIATPAPKAIPEPVEDNDFGGSGDDFGDWK